MNISQTDYRNLNRYRRYPFLDTATLFNTGGVALPVDFIIDAMLYPIDLENGLYLSSVDLSRGVIEFSDTETGATVAKGIWEDSSNEVLMYEDTDIARSVGIVVLGDGRDDLAVGGVVTFTPEASTLAPAAYYPLNQSGVRGILLDDGTFYSGDVLFEGRNGVEVYSHILDGDAVVELNIPGALDYSDDCYDTAVVQRIKLENIADAPVAISGSNAKAFLASVFELGILCPPDNIKLPGERKEPCETDTSTDTIYSGAPAASVTITPTNGHLYILAPSTTDYENSITIDVDEAHPGVPSRAGVQRQGLSLDARENLLSNLIENASKAGGRLSIGYRGISQIGRYR